MSSHPKGPGRPPLLQGIGLGGKSFVVLYGVYVVGWTDLEAPMADGRSAAGILEPGPQYQLVKGAFDVYRKTPADDVAGLRAFVEMRDALGLTIHDAGSLPLAARVQLISEWPDQRKVIHVTVSDERYWARFRVRGGPRGSRH